MKNITKNILSVSCLILLTLNFLYCGNQSKDEMNGDLITTVRPNAPSSLAATSEGSSQIKLSWVDSSDNETAFKIERSTSMSELFSQVATVQAGITEYRDTSLNADRFYYYKVRAFNDVGDSDYSNIAFAKTDAVQNSLPATPSGLKATALSFSEIRLEWNDNANNETGFNIFRKDSADAEFIKIGGLGPVSGSAAQYLDTGLIENHAYWYRVQAFNASGNSFYSNEISATTLENLNAPPVVIAQARIHMVVDVPWRGRLHIKNGEMYFSEFDNSNFRPDSVDLVEISRVDNDIETTVTGIQTTWTPLWNDNENRTDSFNLGLNELLVNHPQRVVNLHKIDCYQDMGIAERGSLVTFYNHYDDHSDRCEFEVDYYYSKYQGTEPDLNPGPATDLSLSTVRMEFNVSWRANLWVENGKMKFIEGVGVASNIGDSYRPSGLLSPIVTNEDGSTSTLPWTLTWANLETNELNLGLPGFADGKFAKAVTFRKVDCYPDMGLWNYGRHFTFYNHYGSYHSLCRFDFDYLYTKIQ